MEHGIVSKAPSLPSEGSNTKKRLKTMCKTMKFGSTISVLRKAFGGISRRRAVPSRNKKLLVVECGRCMSARLRKFHPALTKDTGGGISFCG
jgi:hypothetical protein